jgi:hypothetical protein
MTQTSALKSRLPTLVLLLGLLVLGMSAIVAYLARTVLDEDAFSGRVVAALERPALSAFVAREIANGVIAANRDLTGVRPVITTFAQALVKSTAFQVLVRRGAREAHRVMLSSGVENVMLSVPDVGVLLRGALESVSPELADRVPPNVKTVIETRVTGDMAGRVVSGIRAANRVRFLARAGLIAGLLLVFTGVAISSKRRQAFLDTSIGLLAIAAVLALLVPLGRATILGAIPDPQLRGAVSDLWIAFAGGIRSWAVGLATVALMLMAGAAAFLERVTLREIVKRGLNELGTRQPTRGRELARIASGAVIGAFALAAPMAALATVITILGALLLAMAVYQLVVLLAPPGTHAAEQGPPPRLNPGLGVALVTVALAAGAMGALALALRFRPAAVLAASGPVLECNGAAALCDRRLDEITFAGAHNAMGTADNVHWMFPNQDLRGRELLRRGVRAFMLDVWNGEPVGDRVKTVFATEQDRLKFEKAIGPEAFAAAMRIRDRLVGVGAATGLYMCHGFCELGALPFDLALLQIKTFMVEHPSEVILIVLEDYVPPAEIAAAFERQELTGYLYSGPSRGPMPTLRQLIESNQRVVLMGEHQTGDFPWYHPAFEMMQETPYTFHTPEDLSCKPNRGDKDSPLFLINHWIESSPAPRPSNAVLVNREDVLLARARECQKERGKRPNIIAVDFAATGDVVRAAAVLNGLEEEKPAPTPADSAR